MKKVILQISSFAGAIGAEHCYGKLYFDDENDNLETVELTRLVTDKKELEYLSKKCGWKLDPDDPINQFNKPSEIIELAKVTYKQYAPNTNVLLEGRYAVADPQRVVDGPDELMIEGNKLFDEAEAIDWYENDEERMEEISDAWRKLVGGI